VYVASVHPATRSVRTRRRHADYDARVLSCQRVRNVRLTCLSQRFTAHLRNRISERSLLSFDAECRDNYLLELPDIFLENDVDDLTAVDVDGLRQKTDEGYHDPRIRA